MQAERTFQALDLGKAVADRLLGRAAPGIDHYDARVGAKRRAAPLERLVLPAPTTCKGEG
jgi:hypothetical protein